MEPCLCKIIIRISSFVNINIPISYYRFHLLTNNTELFRYTYRVLVLIDRFYLHPSKHV